MSDGVRYESRLQCDAPGCPHGVSAEDISREGAAVRVQQKAKELGWSVAADRRFAMCRDYCRDCKGGPK